MSSWSCPILLHLSVIIFQTYWSRTCLINVLGFLSWIQILDCCIWHIRLSYHNFRSSQRTFSNLGVRPYHEVNSVKIAIWLVAQIFSFHQFRSWVPLIIYHACISSWSRSWKRLSFLVHRWLLLFRQIIIWIMQLLLFSLWAAYSHLHWRHDVYHI